MKHLKFINLIYTIQFEEEIAQDLFEAIVADPTKLPELGLK